MRASGHNGRTSRRGAPFKANHNDRQFDVGKAEHIDPNKTKDNVVLKMYAPTNDTRTLEEYERDFYEKVFEEGQQAKNERYKRQGHSERCKDITEVIKDIIYDRDPIEDYDYDYDDGFDPTDD